MGLPFPLKPSTCLVDWVGRLGRVREPQAGSVVYWRRWLQRLSEEGWGILPVRTLPPIHSTVRWLVERPGRLVVPQRGLRLEPLGGRLVPGLALWSARRSEEHTSELQSQSNLVCRL